MWVILSSMFLSKILDLNFMDKQNMIKKKNLTKNDQLNFLIRLIIT